MPMPMRKNPTVVLRELGFEDLAEWRRYIKDHAAEIVADNYQLGLNKTLKKWHIGSRTLKRLVYEATERAEPHQPVSAEEKFFVYHKDHSMSEWTDLRSLLEIVNMAAKPLEGFEFIVYGTKLTPLTEIRREIVGFAEFRDKIS